MELAGHEAHPLKAHIGIEHIHKVVRSAPPSSSISAPQKSPRPLTTAGPATSGLKLNSDSRQLDSSSVHHNHPLFEISTIKFLYLTRRACPPQSSPFPPNLLCPYHDFLRPPNLRRVDSTRSRDCQRSNSSSTIHSSERLLCENLVPKFSTTRK